MNFANASSSKEDFGCAFVGFSIRLKSENFLDTVPKSAFPPEDPPTPGGYTLRHLRQIYHFSLAPSAPIILLLYPVLFSIFQILVEFSHAKSYHSSFWLAPLTPMILLVGVILSIIFEFLVEFSHAKSCTNHYVRVLFFHDQFHCRFLTLNTTIAGFDYWDIALEKMTE